MSNTCRLLFLLILTVAWLGNGCTTGPSPGNDHGGSGALFPVVIQTAWTSAGPDLHFEPHGLYGYINGGAELFLEFGFECLDVKQYLVTTGDNERQIDVEMYRMTDPPAALGIYLAKCGDENPRGDVFARNTANPYQITAVRGTLFLQVNNFSGDAACLPAMVELVNAVLEQQVAVRPLAIWQYLPEKDRAPGTEFLFRGRFGLEPVYTFGPGDVLLIEGRALGAGARYINNNATPHRRLVVVYADPQAAQEALAHLLANLDPYLEVLAQTPQGMVFKDYADEYGLVRLVADRLEILVRLTEAPDLD